MFETGQVVYGFTPSFRDNNHVPIVVAFHYDHTDYHGITWPVFSEAYTFGLNMTHTHAFEEQNVFDTREKCVAARDKWYEKWLEEQQLSDEEWVEKEFRKYLNRYFNQETVDKYITQLKTQYNKLYDVEIKIYKGKVWAKKIEPVIPCAPIVKNYWHKETKAEKEARLERQQQYNIEKFGKIYKEVII